MIAEYRMMGGPLAGQLIEVEMGHTIKVDDPQGYYWAIDGKNEDGERQMKFIPISNKCD